MNYIIGIDLHGTMLDEQWQIKNKFKVKLVESLKAVNKFACVFICSGNDLTFIKKYICADIREQFSRYILETGCVVSDGNCEEIIIPKDMTVTIKTLEGKLKQKRFPQVKCFGRRLITISLFTRTEDGGLDPAEFYPVVKSVVEKLGYMNSVSITYSNVAVDIIPSGFNKFSGIKQVAKNKKIIGIADSMNDFDLINLSDISFIPRNASPDLIDLIKKTGRSVVDISNAEAIENGPVYQSFYKSTQGVIEILDVINRIYG